MLELNEHEPYRVDREGWTAGPWDNEPDKLNWVDPATDLDCMLVRNHHGAWCGYVGVQPGHPWHGKDYQSIEMDVQVHGGLTYSNKCAGDICHVPEPGRPDDVHWFGFDCNHLWDVAPGMEAQMRRLRREFPEQGWPDKPDSLLLRESYKDMAYAKAQVESLALQAQEAANGS